VGVGCSGPVAAAPADELPFGAVDVVAVDAMLSSVVVVVATQM